MANETKRGKLAEYRKRAEAYFRTCDEDGRAVTIGGFCRTLDITLETLRKLSEQREERGERYEFLDRFWTRYFAAAEADLNEKDTQAAAKFKLERLMPLFEGQAAIAEEAGITVCFDSQIEALSR